MATEVISRGHAIRPMRIVAPKSITITEIDTGSEVVSSRTWVTSFSPPKRKAAMCGQITTPLQPITMSGFEIEHIFTSQIATG